MSHSHNSVWYDFVFGVIDLRILLIHYEKIQKTFSELFYVKKEVSQTKQDSNFYYYFKPYD
jgi:hypothetical protein